MPEYAENQITVFRELTKASTKYRGLTDQPPGGYQSDEEEQTGNALRVNETSDYSLQKPRNKPGVKNHTMGTFPQAGNIPNENYMLLFHCVQVPFRVTWYSNACQMKRIIHLVFFALIASNCFSQTFTAGNFVVVRIGSGAMALVAGEAQPVYVDEYSPCGDLVRSIPMPVVVSGNNKRLTLPISTSDYTEGYISLSQDGNKLALAGYDADPGTAAVSAAAATAVKRIVAIVDQNGR